MILEGEMTYTMYLYTIIVKVLLVQSPNNLPRHLQSPIQIADNLRAEQPTFHCVQHSVLMYFQIKTNKTFTFFMDLVKNKIQSRDSSY